MTPAAVLIAIGGVQIVLVIAFPILSADGRVMEERIHESGHRTLKAGQIVFNNKRSVFECLVRNLSDSGAYLQVNRSIDIPVEFELDVDGETRPCRLIWMTNTRAGIEFRTATKNATHTLPESAPSLNEEVRFDQFAVNELVTLRAALDLVPIGILLLDADMRAQFINRAFRRMWRLPDEKAECRSPFIALLLAMQSRLICAFPMERSLGYTARRYLRVAGCCATRT